MQGMLLLMLSILLTTLNASKNFEHKNMHHANSIQLNDRNILNKNWHVKGTCNCYYVYNIIIIYGSQHLLKYCKKMKIKWKMKSYFCVQWRCFYIYWQFSFVYTDILTAALHDSATFLDVLYRLLLLASLYVHPFSDRRY